MSDQESISNAWGTIDEFRTLSNPDKTDVVELDIAMMIVLRSLDTESAAAEEVTQSVFRDISKNIRTELPKRNWAFAPTLLGSPSRIAKLGEVD